MRSDRSHARSWRLAARKSESKNKSETRERQIASNLLFFFFFFSYKRFDDVISAAQLSARYFVEDRCNAPLSSTFAKYRSSSKISRGFLSIYVLRNRRQRFILEICSRNLYSHTRNCTV